MPIIMSLILITSFFQEVIIVNIFHVFPLKESSLNHEKWESSFEERRKRKDFREKGKGRKEGGESKEEKE